MIKDQNTQLDGRTLREVFNESAQKAYDAFPKLEKLAVVTCSEHIYVSPESAEVLLRKPQNLKALLEKKKNYFKETNNSACAQRFEVLDDKQIIKTIALNGEISPTLCVSGEHAEKISMLRIFDHELGHLVVPLGWPHIKQSSPHIAECAADAFAALRHIQRFGQDTDFFDLAPKQRGYHIILGSKIHYTAHTIMAVGEAAKNNPVKELSLQQTASLANIISRVTALPEATIDKIRDAYKKPQETYSNKKPNDDMRETVKQIVEVMLNNLDDEDIYRAGKLYISRPGIEAIVKGLEGFGEDALQKMQEHEKKTKFKLVPKSCRINKKKKTRTLSLPKSKKKL